MLLCPTQTLIAITNALRSLHGLRDEFAKAVLTGLVSDPNVQLDTETELIFAEACYRMADAMLAAKFSTMTAEVARG